MRVIHEFYVCILYNHNMYAQFYERSLNCPHLGFGCAGRPRTKTLGCALIRCSAAASSSAWRVLLCSRDATVAVKVHGVAVPVPKHFLAAIRMRRTRRRRTTTNCCGSCMLKRSPPPTRGASAAQTLAGASPFRCHQTLQRTWKECRQVARPR